MSEKSVILLEDIRLFQAYAELIVSAALSPFLPNTPEKKTVEEGDEESPVGGPEGPVEDVCQTEAGTASDVEDGDVAASCGVADVGISGYESERFTLLEILRRKCLLHNVSFQVFKNY